MFKTLKIWQKLALVAVVMAIPLATLIVLFVNSRNEQIDSARSELTALNYEASLRRVLETLPKHRDLMYLVLSGDPSKLALAETAGRKVDEAFTEASHFDETQGAKLASTEKWNALKTRWNEIKAQTRTAAAAAQAKDNFNRHTELASDVVEHMRYVADRSGLTTDPQLDSYYLWDLMISGAINGAQYSADLRSSTLAVANKGAATVEEAAQLLVLSRQFQFTGALVERDSASMFRYNPALKSALSDSLATAADAASKLNQISQTELSGNVLKVDGRAFSEPGSLAANAYYQLFDKSQKIMSDLVVARIGNLNSQRSTQLGMVLLVALLAVALVYGIWRGINRQVNSMTRTFARISDGDLQARAEVLGNDELGRLAISLNNMTDNTLSLVQGREERDRIQKNITKLLEEVSGVADGDLTQEAEVTADLTGAIADSFNYMIAQLRQIISHVQRTTTQVTSSASDVRHTATKLAEGSEVQAKQIVQASNAIAEMAKSIQQVSHSATQATEVANKALQSAQGGAATVRRTIDGMNAIRTQVQETAKRIKRLGESSQEIGEIVELIGDIADRTSILALNASIQAAMAGEAGKGFGVVAEEVERLAERATEATKKISNLIKSVQGDTNEAIAAMEETTREVVGGSQLANEAGRRLDEIEAVSRQITGLVQSISELSREQAQGSEAVSRNVAGISAYTQQTAAGALQAEESTRRLSDLAVELNSSLKRFKLPKVAA